MKKQDVIILQKKDKKYWRLHFTRHYQNVETSSQTFFADSVTGISTQG